jgi:hypothetical protein
MDWEMADWNTMDAQHQAWWLCRDDPERVTARCKTVTPQATVAANVAISSASTKPSNWNTMDAEHQAWWLCRGPQATVAANVAISSASTKPSNWNTMGAEEQAQWLCREQAQWLCRDDPSRVTARCKMVSAPSQTPVTTTAAKPVAAPATRAAQTEQPQRVVAAKPRTAAPAARWTADACESERQSFSVLSERINQSIAQLKILAALPPPHIGPREIVPGSSPAAEGYFGYQNELLRQQAAARVASATKQVKTQQERFDTQFLEWQSHCTQR